MRPLEYALRKNMTKNQASYFISAMNGVRGYHKIQAFKKLESTLIRSVEHTNIMIINATSIIEQYESGDVDADI